ncbi:MAG: dienelactone hydrolase family protein [Chlamydiia bacterium]|nr:dienelactone hydrolase family protein [Chlamydiia bacterium]
MKTELIEYHHQGKTLEAFLAFDSSAKGAPTILIFHAWRGRDEFAIEKAKALAEKGYVGVALDCYGKGILGSCPEENQALMEPFIKDRTFLLKRMEAGVEAVIAHSAVDPKKMSAIGFCFGGLCALDLARSGADIQGVISFHGLLNPPSYVSKPKGKLLVLHGYDDPMVPPEEVQAFEKEMTEAGADWQLHVYGKTVHAFTNPIANDPQAGTVYSPLAEARAFQSLYNFLSEIYQ